MFSTSPARSPSSSRIHLALARVSTRVRPPPSETRSARVPNLSSKAEGPLYEEHASCQPRASLTRTPRLCAPALPAVVQTWFFLPLRRELCEESRQKEKYSTEQLEVANSQAPTKNDTSFCLSRRRRLRNGLVRQTVASPGIALRKGSNGRSPAVGERSLTRKSLYCLRSAEVFF